MTERDIKKPLIPEMPQCMTSFLPTRLNPGPLLGTSQCPSPSAVPAQGEDCRREKLPFQTGPLGSHLPCSTWCLFADLPARCSCCSESHPPTPRGGGGGHHSDPLPWSPPAGQPCPHCSIPAAAMERQPRPPPCFHPSSLFSPCCCCSQLLEHQLSTCSSPAPGRLSSLRQRFLKCTVCRDLPSPPPALSPALCHLAYLSHLYHRITKPWAASVLLHC